MNRSRRLGVGKEIGGAIYLHRSYERLVGPDLRRAKRVLPPEFLYDVVKWRPDTGAISFVSCPGFDSEPEPVAGDVFVVTNGQGRLVKAPGDPWVYHHKWLFVADDYAGFDTASSRRRSESWAGRGIDRSRIGRRSQWAAVKRRLGLK